MKPCKFVLLSVVITMAAAAVCYKRFKQIERRKEDRERLSEESDNMLETDEDSLVTLKDSEGNDVSFEFLDMIEYEGDNYVVLRPCSPEGESVVILKEVTMSYADTDYAEYESIDDQNVMDAVFDIFKYKFRDEFIFPV